MADVSPSTVHGEPADALERTAVLPHVQAFANDLQNATGVSSFGTYPAHSIAQNRAIDAFFEEEEAEASGAAYLIFHGVGDHAASDAICVEDDAATSIIVTDTAGQPAAMRRHP